MNTARNALNLLLLLPLMPLTDASAADEFQSMFNGKDFSGWVLTNTPAETWSFQGDLLVCTGKPIGEIRTEKMYQNFILELEWRHMVPRGNAGVFVWADDIPSRGVPFHRGIEVQVLENAYGNTDSHTTHGDIFPIHGATMTPINGRKNGSRAFPTENRSLPSPEWNKYRIECRDGAISLAVNGKVVTQGQDCVPRKGYICLESEGGIVHYRNIKIQELPSSEIQADHVAIFNRGYASIYNGLNLNGWQPHEPTGSRWQANDWVLAFKGEEGERGELATSEDFAFHGCVVDVRLKSASSSAKIQVGDQWQIDFAAPEISRLLQTQGSWNRIEVRSSANGPNLLINNEPTPQSTAWPAIAAGSLKLLPTGPVDFCNIYNQPEPTRQ